MSWMEPTVKRGSLQRGNRVEEDEGMEDNSLYSSRQTGRDFRVCVRRTEASDRCRLKGDGVLRADVDALHLIDKTGDIMLTWPYRYLRRFGRDKSSFSFEAGRRCDSGEGSFEFDTKQGNFLFQAVEAAINLQRVPGPHRQTSGGGQPSPEMPHNQNLPPVPQNQNRMPPLPQPRIHIPQSTAAQGADGVYSMVTESPNIKETSTTSQQQQQQRPLLTRLEPPVDKALTGVKSLTLDTCGVPVPRKNQVKMISSCPLPQPAPEPRPNPVPAPNQNPNQMYSQITMQASKRGTKREKRSGGGGVAPPPLVAHEPEYSLPFDTIAMNVMTNILDSHQAHRAEPGADPLYDSIDEMKIRNIFPSDAHATEPTDRKVEHIYDEPEGCAAAAAAITVAMDDTTEKPPTSVYDDPEEVRGDAWRIMGTAADPKGHEYPYNPRVDDYAVPKRPQRVAADGGFPVQQRDSEDDVDEMMSSFDGQ